MLVHKVIRHFEYEDYEKFTKDGVLTLPEGYEEIRASIEANKDVHTIIFPATYKVIHSLLIECENVEVIIFMGIPEICEIPMYSVNTSVKYIVVPDEYIAQQIEDDKFKILIDNINATKEKGKEYNSDQTQVQIISYSEYLEMTKNSENIATI